MYFIDGSSIEKFALHKICGLDQLDVIILRRVSALLEPLCYSVCNRPHTESLLQYFS